MKILCDILWLAFGISLIFYGILALVRRSTWTSSDGADEREYRGIPAALLGATWILLGLVWLGFFGTKYRDFLVSIWL